VVVPAWSAAGTLEAACFEAHPDAQLIVDSGFEVVASNRAARQLIAEAHGPRALAERLVKSSNGVLRNVRAQIESAIREQRGAPELVLPISPSVKFAIRICPLGPTHDRALVIVRRCAAREAHAPRKRFRFTPTESHVAERLANGHSVAEIALQLGISIETVRCHLKQAFAKAGVHRQAELVAVLLGR
jgi:DNA-binding CsgD family transcriptional regulator